MIQKIIFLILLPFFLLNCDYNPIYSSNNNYDFYIEEINQEGNNEINALIRNELKKYRIKDNKKKLIINNISTFGKNSQSKNKSGDTDQYLLNLKIKFIIESENEKKSFTLSENFLMKNFNNKFDERNYEKTIKSNMTKLIVNNLIVQLSRMQ